MGKTFSTFMICLFMFIAVPLTAQVSFFELCKTGSPAEIEKALKAGETVKANEYSITPLMWVAQYNPNPDVITMLIKNGSSVNEADNTGTTPLMYAAMNTTNPEVIMALLKAGADGKLKNSDGKTAYDFAEFNDNIKRTPAYEALKNAQEN